MPEQDENLINNSSSNGHGGARPGAGRKKGSMNEATKQRAAAKLVFQQRVMKHTDEIFNAQLDKAVGEKYLMVKVTEYATDKQGNRGKIRREYHQIVTDPKTIIAYLDGELKGNVSLNDPVNTNAVASSSEFYYMTTKPADNMALSDLLNRAYGKPDESLDLSAGESLTSKARELSDDELNERIAAFIQRRGDTDRGTPS